MKQFSEKYKIKTKKLHSNIKFGYQSQKYYLKSLILTNIFIMVLEVSFNIAGNSFGNFLCVCSLRLFYPQFQFKFLIKRSIR